MNLQTVKTENQLNKLIKSCRQANESAIFFITSPWDSKSDMIREELEALNRDSLTIFEVDYFELPHAFCIFRAITPSLVRIRGKRTEVLDNTISIRTALGYGSHASLLDA